MQRPSLKVLLKFISIGMMVYLLQVLYIYFNQHNIVYIPSRHLGATPDLVDLTYETVMLNAEDGTRIFGWYLPRERSRATLLFLHGNAGNISHRLSTLSLLHDLGLSVLIIDYRGYGESEGKPSESGIYMDAEAAWRYLTKDRGVPANEILIHGRSLGGAVAAYLASRNPAQGVILESTFTSAEEMAAELYPWLPTRWLTRLDYNTRKRLSGIQMPLMIIHSPADEIIPFEQAEALYQAGNPPKRFLQLSGSHNYGFMENADKYRQGLNEFISDTIDKRDE
jgi:fermentation-respiration switch protein FrsA (DUF1100 family)